MRVVICDDDAGLRRVIEGLPALDDHEVVAETDHAAEAVDLVTRFHADLLLLDLSLGAGGGIDALDELRARDVPCAVVVFTSFAGERDAVLAAGASAVVEKPDFAGLEREIQHAALLVAQPATAATGPRRDRRRGPSDPRPDMAAAGEPSPSGLEPRATFKAALGSSIAGDEVMVIADEDLDEVGADGARALFAADHRLAVARLLRETLRAQDRLSVDEDANFVVLLLGGRPEAAERVFTRLDAQLSARHSLGIVRAGWAARQGSEPPEVTVARAEGALVTNRDHRLDRLTQG
jgi:chemotaxis response regulator CheB